MKRESLFLEVSEYVAPQMEVNDVVVEHGFDLTAGGGKDPD
jgi:hypothetical protein